jgi:hypothetical protein
MNFHHTTEQAVNFMRALQKREGTKKRGPFLAELELEHLLIQNKQGDVQKLGQLLAQYYEKFGSKTICYEDMKPYLSHVDRALLQQLVVPSQEPLLQIYYRVTFRKLERHFQVQVDPKDLLVEYINALPFGTKLEKTENQYGDEFLILAVHYLIDRAEYHTGILLLEYGLTKSEYNFQFKILLIRLYSKIGASAGNKISEVFLKSLELKHIQWESLSYLIFYELGRFGNYKRQKGVADKILEFYYNEHLKETPELTVLPYNSGAYSKINEFTKFRKRMDNSYQVYLAQISQCFLDLVQMRASNFAPEISQFLKISLLPFNNDVLWGTFKFEYNEDLSVLLDFTSENVRKINVPQELGSSEEQKRNVLQRRYLALRTVQLNAELVDLVSKLTVVPKKKKKNANAVESNPEQVKETLRENVKQLQVIVEHLSALQDSERAVIEPLVEITRVMYGLALDEAGSVTDAAAKLSKHFESLTFDLKPQEPETVATIVQTLETIIPYDACVSIWSQFFGKWKGTVDAKAVISDVTNTSQVLVDKLSQLSTILKQGQKESAVKADATVIGTEEWKRYVEVNSANVNASIMQTLSNITVVASESIENLRSKF